MIYPIIITSNNKIKNKLKKITIIVDKINVGEFYTDDIANNNFDFTKKFKTIDNKK